IQLVYYSDSITSSSHSIFFSFLLIPPLPRSTLFPYTTLFRSKRVLFSSGVSGRNPKTQFNGNPAPGFQVQVTNMPARASVLRNEDRKSTRLNSSHVAISYAVFCLKKKSESCAVQTVCQYCPPD